MYGDPSLLYLVSIVGLQSMSPDNILAKSLNKGGTRERILEAVIINTFSILMHKKENKCHAHDDKRDKENMSKRRVDILLVIGLLKRRGGGSYFP